MLTHRRTVGAGLLAIVLTAVLVAAGLLRPDVAGAANAAFPTPPAPGACLLNSPEGPVVVPCSEPHLLQVTRSWSTWDWDRRGLIGTDADDLCELATADFLGSVPRVDDWAPIPLRMQSIVTGFPASNAAPWGWRACAMFPESGDDQLVIRPGFRGSLLGATAMTTRPAELRSCYTTLEHGWLPTPCSVRHSGEFLMQRSVQVAGGQLAAPARAALLASCRRVAPQLIGRTTDDDDRVRLTVRLAGSGPGIVLRVSAPTGAVPQTFIGMRCALEGVNGYQLTDTVIGLGGRQLPVS